MACVIWFQEPSFWKRKDMFIISCKIIVAFRFPSNIWHSHTWHFCLKVVVPHFAQTVCWQCAPIKAFSQRFATTLCLGRFFRLFTILSSQAKFCLLFLLPRIIEFQQNWWDVTKISHFIIFLEEKNSRKRRSSWSLQVTELLSEKTISKLNGINFFSCLPLTFICSVSVNPRWLANSSDLIQETKLFGNWKRP